MIRSIDQIKLSKATTSKVDIKIGDYLNQTFTVFSNHWKDFTAFAFISMILTFVSVITIVGPYLIMYPLYMGYGNVVDKIENNEAFEFNDFFIGFKKWTHFIPYLLLVLGIMLALMIPIFLILGGIITFSEYNPDVVPFFGFSVFALFPIVGIVILLVTIISFLVPYFIYHGNFGTIKSIKFSYQVVKNNFWYMILFVFIFSIISQIGVYLCFVGIFASMPIGYIMTYLMVKDLFLMDGKNEIDTIGQSQEL